jgi:hypothetical protein
MLPPSSVQSITPIPRNVTTQKAKYDILIAVKTSNIIAKFFGLSLSLSKTKEKTSIIDNVKILDRINA